MSKQAIVTFNSGEVTPEVDARPDIEKYIGGCRRADNMIPDQFGTAERRPGTELIIAGNGAACYYEEEPANPAKIQITDAAGLQAINNDLDGDYEIMNNIDLAGVDWTQLGPGATPFTGTLDGRHHTISNLTMLRGTGSDAGLFRGISEATVQKVHLKDIEFQGLNDMAALVGALARSSTIFQCSATGTITGTPSIPPADPPPGGENGIQILFAAGFVFNTSGLNGVPCEISECWCDVDITQGERLTFLGPIGGFIKTTGGQVGTPGSIHDCYTLGNHVESSTRSQVSWGGFCQNATQGQPITNSYSIGLVPGVNTVGRQPFSGLGAGGFGSDNFWDTDVVGGTIDDIATGKTTEEMFQQATYTDAGWDFDTIWQIDEGNDYPKFQWQDEADLKQKCQQV